MSGEPGTYTAGTPEDVKLLRQQLIDMISGGMNKGATSYSGPLGTTADSGQLAAMNMLMGLSGNGKYTAPGMYSMPNQPSMKGYYGAGTASATSGPNSNPNTGPPAAGPAGPANIYAGAADSAPGVASVGIAGPRASVAGPDISGIGPTPSTQISPSIGVGSVGAAAAPTSTMQGGNFNPRTMFQIMSALRGMR
jgi:hypothetical protein